jgi:hypothetical protein
VKIRFYAYASFRLEADGLTVIVRPFVSSTSAVDYPKASSLASACYEWLKGQQVA